MLGRQGKKAGACVGVWKIVRMEIAVSELSYQFGFKPSPSLVFQFCDLCKSFYLTLPPSLIWVICIRTVCSSQDYVSAVIHVKRLTRYPLQKQQKSIIISNCVLFPFQNSVLPPPHRDISLFLHFKCRSFKKAFLEPSVHILYSLFSWLLFLHNT